jgi:hypothetical protein
VPLSQNDDKFELCHRKVTDANNVATLEKSGKLEGTSLSLDSQKPEESSWQWFSGKSRVFEPLLADPREAQVNVAFLRNKHGDSFFDLIFGGDAPLKYRQTSDNDEISITVRGMVASRFETFSDSFNQLNTDYVGGLAIGRRQGNKSCEVFLYHQSSHLGDETLEEGRRQRINYSRETLRFLYSVNYDKNLRIYGGPSVHFRSEPKDLQGRVILQGGIERKFRWHDMPMYAALDLQSKQENDWDVNLAAQLGVYLGNSKEVRNQQRLFITLFNGFSNMGQFYNERELQVLLGIGFNF